MFWGNHLRCFDNKISLDEPLVLSRSFCAKATQSTTAITSIVVALATNLKNKCKSLSKFLLLFAYPKSRIPLYLVIASPCQRQDEAIQKDNQ